MDWLVETLNKTVDEELMALQDDLLSKFFFITKLLEEFGPYQVKQPYVKAFKIKGASLWEMRMKGKSGIARAIYVITSSKRIVVLHVFVKKTQKTTLNTIRKSLKRLEELQDDGN